MDRLSALTIAFALVACKDAGDHAGEPPPSRTNSAKAGAHQAASAVAFCDLHASADKAAPLAWPALAVGDTAPPAATTWRWINVWATWCKPCVEEMPRLARWRDKLSAGGHPIELAFVSVDESADDVAAFRKLHPDTPATLRIASGKTAEAWFAQLGLVGAPPIPIHVFVDPQSRIRCARAGAVRDQDFAVIERLLAE
ncbi:MAG: Thioredoxin [Deltaproteobacteria bacterium]|nr:Thioredoxin [Deltaproteobacteria bacterium]